MNEKGQTLAIFVLLLPIILLVFAVIYDQGISLIEKNKLNDLSKFACTMLKQGKTPEEVEVVLRKNNQKLEKVTIKTGVKRNISLESRVDILFERLSLSKGTITVQKDCKE